MVQKWTVYHWAANSGINYLLTGAGFLKSRILLGKWCKSYMWVIQNNDIPKDNWVDFQKFPKEQKCHKKTNNKKSFPTLWKISSPIFPKWTIFFLLVPRWPWHGSKRRRLRRGLGDAKKSPRAQGEVVDLIHDEKSTWVFSLNQNGEPQKRKKRTRLFESLEARKEQKTLSFCHWWFQCWSIEVFFSKHVLRDRLLKVSHRINIPKKLTNHCETDNCVCTRFLLLSRGL